jgi:2-oxoglutarate ferredoxin oxidoreductase subunit alpha
MPTSKFAPTSSDRRALTAITNSTYTDPRQRQLFKNIIYLGAMCALLDMDPKLVEQLIGEQYKGKEEARPPISTRCISAATGRCKT